MDKHSPINFLPKGQTIILTSHIIKLHPSITSHFIDISIISSKLQFCAILGIVETTDK